MEKLGKEKPSGFMLKIGDKIEKMNHWIMRKNYTTPAKKTLNLKEKKVKLINLQLFHAVFLLFCINAVAMKYHSFSYVEVMVLLSIVIITPILTSIREDLKYLKDDSNIKKQLNIFKLKKRIQLKGVYGYYFWFATLMLTLIPAIYIISAMTIQTIRGEHYGLLHTYVNKPLGVLPIT